MTLLAPKSVDIVIAVTFGVMISVYKLGPLLKEITEKERLQLEQRRLRLAKSVDVNTDPK